MYRYVLIFVWIACIALIGNCTQIKREEEICGKKQRRYPFWFAFLVFFPIILMAGFRGLNFADSGTYASTFKSLPISIKELIIYALTAEKDNLFYLFAGIIKMIIGENIELYFFILALIQGTILVAIYRKYSSKYILSILLFLISTDYIAWMFNGVRQFLAVTIIFAATDLMLKKKYVATFIVIIFASLFHQSALIMIPIVIIAQGKAWNKKTVFFILLTLIIITCIGQFTNILNSALSNTQYSEVINNYTNSKDDGTNPIRVMIYSVPALFAFIGRKKIKKSNDMLIHFCTNMSLIVAGLYIISMFTSGIYMGRIPIYASLYGYILLPWQIDSFFTSGSKKLLYGMMIGLYSLFYYYQMHIIWGLI